jgi:hypothetical protein
MSTFKFGRAFVRGTIKASDVVVSSAKAVAKVPGDFARGVRAGWNGAAGVEDLSPEIVSKVEQLRKAGWSRQMINEFIEASEPRAVDGVMEEIRAKANKLRANGWSKRMVDEYVDAAIRVAIDEECVEHLTKSEASVSKAPELAMNEQILARVRKAQSKAPRA